MLIQPRALALILLAPAFLAEGAAAALVLNEILYDPEGGDAGFEWVELYNSGPWAATLDGIALESGNGSAPGRWTRVWEGQSGQWIEAGGFYWIGGPWRGRGPDSPASLGLQNGPDGVRLLREGLELDRVGWGDLIEPEYFEGLPAPSGPSGRSLARTGDGIDSDSNRADFEEASPSPGRPNHPEVDLSVRLERAGRALPIPGGGGEIAAEVRLENLGTLPLDPARVILTADGRTLLPDPVRAIPPVAAGGSTSLSVLLAVRGDAGEQFWACLAHLEGDAVPENDQDTLRLWVGHPELRFSEIAPRPDSGGTEWLELAVVGPGPIQAAGWSIVDHGGSVARLDTGPALMPGDLRIVAQDPAHLRGVPGEAFLLWSGSWPTLNDTAMPAGAADSLFLINPLGRIVDWAVYGEAPRGMTWIPVDPDVPQRGLPGWAVAPGPPGGTPGFANPGFGISLPDESSSGAAPPACSLRRDPGGVGIRLPSESFPGDWQVQIVDLEGELIWSDAGQTPDRAEQWTRWNGLSHRGETCPAGLYVIQIMTRPEGRPARVERQPLVLGR